MPCADETIPSSSDIGQQYAVELGKMAGLFAWHFNQGLRANFFALALLGWWINVWFLMASSSIIVLVLYRREFCSKSLIVANKIRELAEVPHSDEALLPNTAESFHDRRFLQVTANVDMS